MTKRSPFVLRKIYYAFQQANTSWNSVELQREKTFEFVKTNQRWNMTLFQRWNMTFQRWNLALFQRLNMTLFQHWNLTLFQRRNSTLFQRRHLALFQRWYLTWFQRWNLTLKQRWKWVVFMGCFPDVEINIVVSTLKIGCSTSQPKINLAVLINFALIWRSPILGPPAVTLTG